MHAHTQTSAEPQTLELLAPARDLSGGLAALQAGADALYVGAPEFGARSAAGVSIEDIAALCQAAHRCGAKVYAALNTVLTDPELPRAQAIAHELYRVGADALIIQDAALLELDLPPIPLHASTQCHNLDPRQVALWHALGIEQTVLPREMDIASAQALHAAVPDMRLEAFVHGALCVCFSGRCYISQVMRGRSANRGACAQYCRLSYDLEDARGVKLRSAQYLLSLKDLNRSLLLGQMVQAGVRSFKIEGRLKNNPYVTNVTAHYRRLLDHLIRNAHGLYRRASAGLNRVTFLPDPDKSFNRSFTSYNHPLGTPFPQTEINPYTPKSIGEAAGTLRSGRGRTVQVQSPEGFTWQNGDGLLGISPTGAVAGAFVNDVQGDKLYLSGALNLPAGSLIYRNGNAAFERLLANPKAAQRVLPIELHLSLKRGEESADTALLKLTARLSGSHLSVSRQTSIPYQAARTPQEERLKRTLSELGGSGPEAAALQVEIGEAFVPVSTVAELRRRVVDALLEALEQAVTRERDERGERARAVRRAFLAAPSAQLTDFLPQSIDYSYNVNNKRSEMFYRRLGVQEIAYGPESGAPFPKDGALMTTRHCLLRTLGYCTRSHRKPPFTLPLSLVHGSERFRLEFHCRECLMTVHLP